MCNMSCIAFGKNHLTPERVAGLDVLEVGSMNINGSLRAAVTALAPRSYLGVDMEQGPGVDRVCDVGCLSATFGTGQFDLVICTEVLEHVKDWKTAISNMKHVLRPNGYLLITTRSKGFGFHGYPCDFWRYELEDMLRIFGDMSVLAAEADTEDPGVFVLVQKPKVFRELDLSKHRLYSVLRFERCRTVNSVDVALYPAEAAARTALARILPKRIKKAMKMLWALCVAN